jgi:hypothetical protein
MVSSLILPGSSACSLAQRSQAFYPVVIISRQCQPDQVRIWKMTAWTDVGDCIAGTGPGTDIGERTWVKSSDLYQGQSSSACGSAEEAAGETAASCRRPLPSTNRASKRVSWQTAEAWITEPFREPWPIARRRVIDTATGKIIGRCVAVPLHNPRSDLAAQPLQAVQRVSAGFRDFDALDCKVFAEEFVMHRTLVELLRRQYR